MLWVLETPEAPVQMALWAVSLGPMCIPPGPRYGKEEAVYEGGGEDG